MLLSAARVRARRTLVASLLRCRSGAGPRARLCRGSPKKDPAGRWGCASPFAAARASGSPPARGLSCSARESPSGRSPRCHSARNTTRSCGLRFVHQELEQRHGAIAAGEEIARELAQLPEALRVEAVEQHVVDAPL